MEGEFVTKVADQNPRSHHRDDIQVLRALAICMVLAHHLRIAAVPGGFLGVDVFFVLSGFLMSGLIDSALTRGTFRFADFYSRRIRRLLPAAFATLAGTALVAPWVLDSNELHAFRDQLIGSFAFVANIVLWRQTDYFSTAGELKPLLHMWSLGVEEQFYLFLPVVLFFCPARWRLALVTACTAGSLALCLIALPLSPSATFYLLPTRAWELGLGAMVALAVRRGILPALRARAVRIVALAVIVAVAVTSSATGHPGVSAIVVCLATAALVVPGLDWRAKGVVGRGLCAIGDRSYSLYLVHWPVLAFVANMSVGPVPAAVLLLLLIPIAGLAELQYRLVEQVWRYRRVGWRYFAGLVGIMLAVLGYTSLAMAIRPGAGQAQDRQPNFGLAPECAARGGPFTQPPQCQIGSQPETLLWGDSIAMDLAPGLEESLPGGLVQATMPSCSPLLGIAPTDLGSRSLNWARQCAAFNDSVIDFVAHTPSIRTVVLSSILIPYLQQEAQHPWKLAVKQSDGSWQVVEQDPAVVRRSLERTVETLRSMGRRVILFAPPPNNDIDYSRCALRRQERLPVMRESSTCSMPLADYRRVRRPVLDFLTEVEGAGIVPVVRLDTALCDNRRCRVQSGEVILYADHAHLGRRGSRVLAQEMDWGAIIADRAD